MVDTLRYLVDKPIKKVSYHSKPEKVPQDEVDLAASFILHFEGDIIGRASATYEGSRNTYLEVLGTRGYIRAFDWNLPDSLVRLECNLDGIRSEKEIQNLNNYVAEIDAFADAIKNNTDEPISGKDGLINQEIIDLVNL
jgi:predicted dehydrogenase